MLDCKDNSEYIFVYGTLRRDLQNPINELLRGYVRFVGRGKFRGVLYDLGEYPGAIYSENPSDYVFGEVYAFDDKEYVFRVLDDFEDYSPDDCQQSLYYREKTRIILDDGNELTCWIYIYNRPVHNKCNIIPSGDYSNYLKGE